MTGPPLAIGSLFTGYGGLDTGVRTVLNSTVAWHCENDPAPSQVLAHHYPDVPNLGDITAVDWATIPPADILTGGFPCQDLSTAGQRRGMRPGTRSGLWEHMAQAIDQLRPGLVVIENVRGLLSAEAHSDVEPCPWCLGDTSAEPDLRALGAILGDLADLGFDAEWRGLRAADVGAPHGRFRVFVVAFDLDRVGGPGWDAAGFPVVSDAYGVGRERRGRARGWWRGSADGGRPAADSDRPGLQGSQPAGRRNLSARGTAPDPEGDGWDEGWPEPAGQRRGPDASVRRPAVAPDPDGGPVWAQPITQSGCGGTAVAGDPGTPATPHADRPRRCRVQERDSEPIEPGQRAALGDDPDGLAVDVDWDVYGPAVQRWERLLGRPAPVPWEPGRNGRPRLSPRLVEWMMGLPDGWVTGVPGVTRNQQLRMLGNGVVPQQAAVGVAECLRVMGTVPTGRPAARAG